MSVRKDERRGTWLVKLHYTNRDGETVDSTKRGLAYTNEGVQILDLPRWLLGEQRL